VFENIALVGATGAVGTIVRQLLEERNFPYKNIRFIASARSAGTTISFKGIDHTVVELDPTAFAGIDLIIASTPDEVAAELVPWAKQAGAVVVDESGYHRMHDDVPLIVPEVNADAIDGYNKKNIIANPNCSTIQMVVALKPLHDAAGIKRIVVSTYQSVSGAGNEAMDELFTQTKGIYVNDQPSPREFPKQIAFNVIPEIDVFMDDGQTREEWKMTAETKKILDPAIKLTATCVRVPTFVGHAEAINIEFERPMDDDEARDILREAPGCMVVDKREPGGYITPVECVGEYATFISRIRVDPTVENGLNIWVVSDNLRKGAALNAIQIAETLVARYLKKAA